MDADSAIDERPKTGLGGFSFSLSNLLMLMALGAIAIAWWVDHNRPSLRKYDVPGPLFISYTVRTSPSSTAGNNMRGVEGIDFQGANIVVYTETGGMVLPGNSLIEFNWSPE